MVAMIAALPSPRLPTAAARRLVPTPERQEVTPMLEMILSCDYDPECRPLRVAKTRLTS